MTGLPLERLVRRVADTPPDFLDEPRIGDSGAVHVAAVVNDLLARVSSRATRKQLQRFDAHDQKDMNRLRLTALLCWLLADEGFVGAPLQLSQWLAALDETARELAANAAAHQYLQDPERREELVRFTLARLGLRPDGESTAQAADRLAALSATERKRLVQAGRDSEARSRALREALQRKQAQESADKWSRE
ncbi:hypothetical protein BH10PSE17_BH10PSE17_23350 [soil metagenome]